MIKRKKLLLASLVIGLMLTGCSGATTKTEKEVVKAPVVEKVVVVKMTMEEANKALFKAAGKGDIPGIKLAIENGADINSQSKGLTAAMKVLAKRKVKMDALKILLDAKPDFSLENKTNSTILMQAKTAELVNIILASGADVNAKSSVRTTALINASTKLKPEVVKAIIDGGADLEALDARGRSALVWAVLENRVEIISILVEAGANINSKDKDGNTPLIWASEELIISTMLDLGTDINAMNNNNVLIINETIMLSIEAAYDTALSKLIGMGINLNFVDSFGETPLTFSVKRGNPLVVSLLLTGDVDQTVKNKDGKTALDLALETNNQVVIDILSK